MELCYDGALVMPSNYAMMNEDEMTYVDGGGRIYFHMSKSTLVNIVSSAFGYMGKAQGGALGAVIGVAAATAIGPYAGAVVGAIAGLVLADLLGWACGGISAALINKYGSDISLEANRWFLPNINLCF